jgi:hypothetical protein
VPSVSDAMERRALPSWLAGCLVCVAGQVLVEPALAQPLGTFRWQFAPYCNVVTLTVVQTGAIFALDGFDDQCGSGQAASATGTAFPNPNGSIGLGLNLVLTPGGAPSHVDVTIQAATLSGTWRDSAGGSGTFVFRPGAGSGGAPRPTSGAVAFAGPGTAATAARSDHFSRPGSNNTGTGTDALSSTAITGANNTALGTNALSVNLGGSGNTAVGNDALGANVGGIGNTAVGSGALGDQLNANYNSMFGLYAGRVLISGNSNTAIGYNALGNLNTGSNNIGVGPHAGFNVATGSNNIFIGNTGLAADNGTVRIGNGEVTAVYMTGISGKTSAEGVAVFVNPDGRLGTMTSSARFKRDIRPVDDARAIVQALRPVRFFYRTESDDADRTPQIGLIAEEVEKVDHDLVVLDQHGEPETVRYHFLPTLLLAEVQRLEQERAQQAIELTTLRTVLRRLEDEVERLRTLPR